MGRDTISELSRFFVAVGSFARRPQSQGPIGAIAQRPAAYPGSSLGRLVR